MKKIIVSILVCCSLLVVTAGWAGSCYTAGSNTATCVAVANDKPSDYFDSQSQNFYIEPTGDLHIAFFATVTGSGSGQVAYSTANWPSNGPNPYHTYGTGPYSSNSPYVSDAYSYLFPGYLNLSAYAYGAGSTAGLSADW